MQELHQILTTDKERIIRSIYAEDVEFLQKYHQSAGQGLDIAVKDTLANMSDTSSFYRVESESGSLVGFFGIALPVREVYVLEGFHVRPQFRTSDYLKAWWTMIRQLFENEFYTSVSANNIKAIDHLVKNNFTEINSGEVNGKNFVIFMHANNS